MAQKSKSIHPALTLDRIDFSDALLFPAKLWNFLLVEEGFLVIWKCFPDREEGERALYFLPQRRSCRPPLPWLLSVCRPPSSVILTQCDAKLSSAAVAKRGHWIALFPVKYVHLSCILWQDIGRPKCVMEPLLGAKCPMTIIMLKKSILNANAIVTSFALFFLSSHGLAAVDYIQGQK